ncbi:MAG: pseudouridine synthase [Patescibacteria group bacterium]
MNAVLQKVIADSGLASRREAEKMIKMGSIKVNGKLASLGDRADIEKDIITVRGKLLPKKADKIYVKLNKPVGYTCTNRSFPGEQNVFQLISLKDRLFSVGRLDKDSRGIIILTNDGDLAQKISHPRMKHEKIYEVKLFDQRGEALSPSDGRKVAGSLVKGVEIGEGDGISKAKHAEYLQNNLFGIILSEGKKRQIRRMFGALGFRVADLQRINFAGIGLGGIKEGEWRNLSQQEVEKLKNR